ncbi:hypothetical protein GH721_05730 [Kriegella sp. EG-1]|nr:hypothetical protein [Flavobacteriaceae bacterium EG-1]
MKHYNKQIVLDFYKNAIGKADSKYASKVLKDDYIQHNPSVKSGKAGFLEMIPILKQLPKPDNPSKPFMRIISEDNYVVLHFEVEIAAQKKTVLDLYRLYDGLIAEHWDAIKDSAPTTINGNPEVEGPIMIENKKLTDKNKSIVEDYVNNVLINRNFDQLSNYLNSNLIQHNPEVDNGLINLKLSYKDVLIEKVHRIIGEGNFVVTQSEGKKEGKDWVFYDIYRLDKGKIIEHWSVNQLIPPNMAHTNGMI